MSTPYYSSHTGAEVDEAVTKVQQEVVTAATSLPSDLPVVGNGDKEVKTATPTDLKIALGLENVDNTSDADKPVSTATGAALAAGLAGKQDSLQAGEGIALDGPQISAALRAGLNIFLTTESDGAIRIDGVAPESAQILTEGDGILIDSGGVISVNLHAGNNISVTPESPNAVRIDAAVKRGLVMTLAAAYTPSATGADAAQFVVPYDPADGITEVTWVVRRISLRVETAGGAPSVRLEKYAGSDAFSATTVVDVTLSTGAYEGAATAVGQTVVSGTKLRFNVLEKGTAQNWTITVLLGEQ